MANVLITGCSSGFGLLAAVTFAEQGHRVFATMRNPAKFDTLERAALAAGVDMMIDVLDVCDSASVDAVVASVIKQAGSIDIVVNNAGIEMFGAVHLVSDAEAMRQFDTNVIGVIRVCRAVVPYMKAQGHGAIVNVGSVAGKVGTPYGGLYAASKHALEALTESMHFELAHLGIRVHVIEPGQFATALGDNSIVAAAMVGTDEYDRWQAFRLAQKKLVSGEPANPQLVADAIYVAATAVPPALRHPVGADAELIINTKAAMSFEAFESTMRTVLDWHD